MAGEPVSGATAGASRALALGFDLTLDRAADFGRDTTADLDFGLDLGLALDFDFGVLLIASSATVEWHRWCQH